MSCYVFGIVPLFVAAWGHSIVWLSYSRVVKKFFIVRRQTCLVWGIVLGTF